MDERIKEIALRFARECEEPSVTDCGERGIVVTLFAEELAEVVSKTIAELQKGAKPAATVSSVSGSGAKAVRIHWLGGFPQIGDRLYTAPQPMTAPEKRHPVGGWDYGWQGEYNRGWNECIDAMQSTT